MAKAKFIGKTYGTGYNRHFVYLEYEYRGHTYEVYENRARGNEPLAWQHRNEQARIDRLIEEQARIDRLIEDAEKPQKSNPIDWDEVLDMLFMEGKYAE